MQNELTAKLYSFCESRRFCDTVIVIGNKGQTKQFLWAHSAVLAAASEVLYKQLTTASGVKNHQSHYCIALTDCRLEAVEVVVRFLYTGRLEASEVFSVPQNMSEILIACRSMGIPVEKLNGVQLTIKMSEPNTARLEWAVRFIDL